MRTEQDELEEREAVILPLCEELLAKQMQRIDGNPNYVGVDWDLNDFRNEAEILADKIISNLKKGK